MDEEFLDHKALTIDAVKDIKSLDKEDPRLPQDEVQHTPK